MRLLIAILAAGALSVGCGRFTSPTGADEPFVGARLEMDERADERAEAEQAASGPTEADIGYDATDWYAWINLQPPGPAAFHVTGEVTLPHAGFDVSLTPTAPQGFNPAILMLDLTVTEREGFHTQAIEDRQVRYDLSPYDPAAAYDEVNIMYGGEVIGRVDVVRTY